MYIYQSQLLSYLPVFLDGPLYIKSTKFVMMTHIYRRRKNNFTAQLLMLINVIYSNVFISFRDHNNW